MRITAVETEVLHMPLREPYTIAYEDVSEAVNILVKISTDGAEVGLGCAAPDPAVTGETVSQVIEALETIVPEVLVGLDPRRSALCLESLVSRLGNRPSTLAAVDIALHDLFARMAGVPLWVLLGGHKARIATSVTIGILDTEETVRAARELVGRGFVALKLKGGLDVDLDVERVRRVREAVGDVVELRFDANQGYSVADASRFVDGVRAARLELLEQPTPADRPEQLGRVSTNVALPVMADESLLTLRDAFRLAADGQADMVNIKLMKVGGLMRARRIDSVARAASLESMVGCMDECALAIAAGLAFALSSANVVYADLDGHFDLVGDPTAGALVLENGFLVPLDAPGLGIDPDALFPH